MSRTDEQRIMSVKDLNRYIRMKLDGDERMQDIWLRGEISNFTHHSSGHMYFTLKDADSRIKAIMFASNNQKLPFRPKEGTRVVANGYVTVYERDGQYQFYAQQMQPDGIGSLYLAYEQLKQKLQGEGLFDEGRKRPLPTFPRAIGVVTSPTGAAVRDILTTLHRRQPGMTVLVYPVLVQGKQAASSIAHAIHALNRHGEVDVIIAGRGGGSLEELWAFNEEVVARAISESHIPVISAVGHETDFTIADFVADLRAPTPTAAAELAVPHQEDLKQHLHHLNRRLKQAMQRNLAIQQERLLRVQQSPVIRKPKQSVQQYRERLARWNERLLNRGKLSVVSAEHRLHSATARLREQSPLHQTKMARSRLVTNSKQLRSLMSSIVNKQQMQLHGAMRQLDALSPLKVMSRGYSLVYDEQENRLIKQVADVQLGDIIKVKVTDGQLNCQVWSMKGREDDES
ncbi:exodeoxyribonuclease VII large subunit [Paenibacillus sp. UMB4589-SE434]|uniref:exodeoxyribonuclease VII large subunit n=1 Tax=Paenibacillus sp. UMB4589-SE434 TaxID=3046314 RepID=UPI0025505AEA|nr:exodeoxyribonuclease VII large subunit [Paenibacillus sp. UMB4589-SE434]MDK8179346.1 exodeoxyribonuclease VII large subunit [Paenibacillus sp. UMB4589-SE434]